MATEELESTERLPHLGEHGVSLMLELVQIRGTQLHEVEVACVAAEAARPAAEFNSQSHTASEPILRGNVGLVIRSVSDLGEPVAILRQECNLKVEDVISERDGRQMRLT